jgi:hypothetical protein
MDPERARKTAEAIVADLGGAAYYKDPQILATFLQSRFGGSAEQAAKVAAAVVEDLRGAAYYADAEVLAGFLNGQYRETGAGDARP